MSARARGAGSPAGGGERRGLLLGFGGFGVWWGAWSVVLPQVRDRTGVGDGALGLALGAIAVAALPAMPLAGRLVDRYGARRLLPAALLAFAAAGGTPSLAARPLTLVATLLLLGLSTGVLDVVLTAGTAAWERVEQGRLMSAAHGCFSLGVLVGAVLTGVARDAGAGPAAVLCAVSVLLVVCAAAQPRADDRLRSDDQRRAGAQPCVVRLPPPVAGQLPAPPSRRLGPALLALAALVSVSFLIEDGVQSWGALHLERTLGAPPSVSGLAPGLFAAAMAAGRFGAHVLAQPGREGRTVRIGAGAVTAGLLVLGLAGHPGPALAGVVLAGAGVSVLAPTLLSAVGARSAPGRQGSDLALVTTFGYAGFVVGPALVGVLAAGTSLPAALALLACLPAAVVVVGPLALRMPATAEVTTPPVRGMPERHADTRS